MGFVKNIYEKYQEMINYLIIGIMTTVVSLITKYALLFTILDAKDALQLQISVVLSWIVAVIFAYITNRNFVFKSKSENILKEMGLFFSSRIVTLILESVMLWFFITYLKLNTNFYVIFFTLFTQVAVIIGNYILSKFIVFSNKEILLSNKEKWFYIGIFILFLIICYFFPYTHDDWDWGSSTGLERLENGFSNFNGRWIGNSLGMLLTRVRILRALTISITMLGIILYMKKIVNKDNKYLVYFSILLLLLMPIRMFAQSFAWTVGFANYVPPMLIILFMIYKNQKIFSESYQELSKLWILPFLLLGVIGTLFMEHLTIYIVVLGIFLVVMNLVRFKKISLPNIAYLIGSIAGSFLMFSNSGYRTLFGTGDGYRSIENGNILMRAMNTYFKSLKDYLVHNNFALNIVLILLLLVLSYQYYKKFKKELSKEKKKILQLSNAILLLYMVYIFYLHMVGNMNIFIYQNVRNYVEGIFIIFYLLSIISIILIAVKNREKKFRMLFEIGSIIMIASPLLIVTPIGPRCFFATYLLFVLLALELLDIVFAKPKVEILPYLRIPCYLLLIVLVVIYGNAYYVEQKRINYIEEHKVEEELILPKIPNENYMQHPNPRSDWFREQFRKYYGIKKGVKLEFIDYNEWRKQYER